MRYLFMPSGIVPVLSNQLVRSSVQLCRQLCVSPILLLSLLSRSHFHCNAMWLALLITHRLSAVAFCGTVFGRFLSLHAPFNSFIERRTAPLRLALSTLQRA